MHTDLLSSLLHLGVVVAAVRVCVFFFLFAEHNVLSGVLAELANIRTPAALLGGAALGTMFIVPKPGGNKRLHLLYTALSTSAFVLQLVCVLCSTVRFKVVVIQRLYLCVFKGCMCVCVFNGYIFVCAVMRKKVLVCSQRLYFCVFNGYILVCAVIRKVLVCSQRLYLCVFSGYIFVCAAMRKRYWFVISGHVIVFNGQSVFSDEEGVLVSINGYVNVFNG